LVVGVGSVGMLLAQHLAATGIEHVAVMDFDRVETLNLDRLIGASRLDAALHRRKTDVALRLLHSAATAARPDMAKFDMRVTDRAGLRNALDYDLIFCCVDKPWPRAVLNQIAYSDLIPVVDGGIAIDAFTDGSGMRGATMRSHVIRPGRPCMACNHQLELGDVSIDRAGDLDNPGYIAGLPSGERGRENVALLSVAATASMLGQFVSLVITPGGRGDPGPLRYTFAIHDLEHPPYESRPACPVERQLLAGDQRQAHLIEDRPASAAPTKPGQLRLASVLEAMGTRLQDAAQRASLIRRSKERR
jgi:hypothetical protein